MKKIFFGLNNQWSPTTSNFGEEGKKLRELDIEKVIALYTNKAPDKTKKMDSKEMNEVLRKFLSLASQILDQAARSKNPREFLKTGTAVWGRSTLEFVKLSETIAHNALLRYGNDEKGKDGEISTIITGSKGSLEKLKEIYKEIPIMSVVRGQQRTAPVVIEKFG